MATAINRLTWREVPNLEPGWHADGQGLYVRVEETGSRRWVLVFHRAGKRREFGLGSASTVTIAQARKAAAEAREMVRQGIDPIRARKAALASEETPLFSTVAGELMDELEKGWRSPKQRPQWEASLKQHAAAIWKAEVGEVDTEMVLAALRPIWTKNPETASRVRSRIERVLDAAKARGFREGENPARWRGHLNILLTRTRKPKGHHEAMPYQDLPGFLQSIADRNSISAAALRFLILTAARSGEVRGATWEEIAGDVWTVPAERMKGNREHRVPLSAAALGVLASVAPVHRSGLIFPGLKGPLSDMSLLMMMRKAGHTATPHGFRSAFRDWAGDCTSYPRELAEEALAHRVGNAVERAYRRSSALEKRRALMADWGTYCMGKRGAVAPLRLVSA